MSREDRFHRIESSDYSELKSLAYEASGQNRITRRSLRRTGQAPLDASSSTGQSRRWWFFIWVDLERTRSVQTKPDSQRTSPVTQNNALSLNGEFRFTGCDCLLMFVMRVTTRQPKLRLTRSNAFDVQNSNGWESDSRPLRFQYRTDVGLQLSS